MQMQSWAFILFVAVATLLYWTAIPRRFRPHFLLAISLGYYFVCSVTFGVFLLIYLYAMFVIGILIDTAATKRGRTAWMIAGVSIALGLLFLFKARATVIQLGLILMGQAGAAKVAGMLAAKIGIPLGISYFTFRVIHYLVEVYRGKVVRATPLEFFLYVTFFPAMLSGPIHRFYTIGREDPRDSFSEQMRTGTATTRFRLDDFSYGLWRILVGVVKKFVVADFFAKLAMPMTTAQGLLPSVDTWQLWVAAHCYFAYLYIDFSGYTDMAIGLGRLFGFRMMENFKMPLLAHSMQEFWRRWHMSLTYYVMQYVYIPLGGSRKGAARQDLNIMLTIVLIALWHNLTLNMFLWGVMMGLASIVHNRYSRIKKRLFPNHQPTWWGRVLGIIGVWMWTGTLWPLFHHGLRVALIYYIKMFPFVSALFPAVGWLNKAGALIK